MRISSGPSARKLKPRAGSSSCGEETPRSNRTPRQSRPPEYVGTQRGDVGKRRVHERKPHFVGKTLAAGRDGLRIAVDREHAAFSTQGLE